jgi:tripartite-type tricarboxylate transporter receptor subunit TctC
MRALLFAFLLLPSVVNAQYPNRAIRLIIPFAPGGASDFVGRIMQPKMSELLGQPIVVENRPGAAGDIGMETVAKSTPDGYTVFLGNVGSIAINPAVLPVASNPLRDLVAITQVVDVPSVLIVHPSLPVGNIKELIAHAKANPGKLNYGSPGSGSLDRLAMELFRKVGGGLDMVHVPYKGGAGPATAGLMGGETNLMFATAASALPGIKAGRLKLLAVTSGQRMEQMPNAPTVAEEGFPDLAASSWQGLFVPAGTERAIVDRLHAVALQVMAAPEVVTRLKTGGAEVQTSPSPAAFAKYVADETQRWARIAKEANATAD